MAPIHAPILAAEKREAAEKASNDFVIENALVDEYAGIRREPLRASGHPGDQLLGMSQHNRCSSAGRDEACPQVSALRPIGHPLIRAGHPGGHLPFRMPLAEFVPQLSPSPARILVVMPVEVDRVPVGAGGFHDTTIILAFNRAREREQ